MKYAVDRIENDIVVLENIENNKIINVELSRMPRKVKEGDILVFKDNCYALDNNEKKIRLNRIREKMQRLKDSE